MAASYYDKLNLVPGPTGAQIKTAYHALARKCHPDKSKHDATEATEAFKGIKHAYDVLSDPRKRAHYDSTGLDLDVDAEGEKERDNEREREQLRDEAALLRDEAVQLRFEARDVAELRAEVRSLRLCMASNLEQGPLARRRRTRCHPYILLDVLITCISRN